MSPANGCSGCGHDFTSVSLFDAHRVGKHEYTYSEGVCMTPIREDGRRCLSVNEMVGKGWVQNEKARWLDPAKVEKAREAFSALSRSPKQATGASGRSVLPLEAEIAEGKLRA